MLFNLLMFIGQTRICMPNIETEINVDAIRMQKIEKFDNRTIGNLLSFGNSSEHIIRSA